MEKYQNYKVYIHPSEWQNFIFELKKVLDCGYWKRRADLQELASKKMVFDEGQVKSVYSIETPEINFNGTVLKGIMWFWLYDYCMEIFNIVPTIGNHLNCAEYNYIIAQFEESVIKPLGKSFDFKVEKSKAVFDIVDVIGDKGLQLLQNFSKLANKSTGHSHHCDFSRWCDFVFYISRNKIALGVDDLMRWFIENGWTDDIADKMSLDYEYSIQLLDKYEASR